MNDPEHDRAAESSAVFLTDVEVAERRRQSVRTLQRQRAAGLAPPSIKVGRRRLTRRDWLLADEAALLAKTEDAE